MFTLLPEQDGWKHLPKHQMQIYNQILEACPLHVLHELCYVVDKFNNRFTVSSHFVLADKHSLTGREFCLLAHPHEKREKLNKVKRLQGVCCQ